MSDKQRRRRSAPDIPGVQPHRADGAMMVQEGLPEYVPPAADDRDFHDEIEAAREVTRHYRHALRELAG